MEELRHLREKVTVLENKSNDFSSLYQRNSPSRLNKFNILTGG